MHYVILVLTSLFAFAFNVNQAAEDACCFPNKMTFSIYSEDDISSKNKMTRNLKTFSVARDYSAGRLAINSTTISVEDGSITQQMIYVDYSSSTMYIVKNNVCTKKHTSMQMQSRCMLQSEAMYEKDASTIGALPGHLLKTKRYGFELMGVSQGGAEDERYEGVIRVTEKDCAPISEVILVHRDNRESFTYHTRWFYNQKLMVADDAFQLPASCERADEEGVSMSFEEQKEQQKLPEIVVDILRMFANKEVFSGDKVSIERPRVVNQQGMII